MNSEKNLLLPREIFNISAGQIVIVASTQTVDRVDLRAANIIMRVCDRLQLSKPQILFSYSDISDYQHKIFAKPIQMTNSDCVWMYSAYHIKAFVEAYFNLSVEDIVKALYLKKSTWTSRQPTIIHISDEDRRKVRFKETEDSIRRIQDLENYSDDPSFADLTHSIEFLSYKAPTKEKTIKDLEKILSDAIYNDYDIDFDEIIKRIKAENKRSFNLWFDYYPKDKDEDKDEDKDKVKDKVNYFTKFDIYVSKTAKLELTAIHKAVYLAFLLSVDGERLDDQTPKFYEELKAIYKKMPEKVRDEKNGITNKEYISTTTLNGYRTEIRNAIKQHISNNNIVDEFAIEGYKGKPFKIQRSTETLRNKIIKLFGLQSIAK